MSSKVIIVKFITQRLMFVLEVAKASNNSSAASTRAASRFALQLNNKQKQPRSSSIKNEENKNLAVKIPQSRVH